MENSQNIIMVFFLILSIILMYIVVQQVKENKKLKELNKEKEGTIDVLSRGNIEVNSMLKSLRESYEVLDRKYIFSVLLLNIVNTNWIKGIRKISYSEDSSISNTTPTINLKYDLDLDTYIAKPLFKKENITEDLELFISIHGDHYTPLDHYVRALNINKAEFEEKGGVIPTTFSMRKLIENLNKN